MPAIIRACHPEPTATVTMVAALLAVAADRPQWEVVLVALAVLCGQLSIGWSNDWIDFARDTAIGRTDKPLAAGKLSRRTVGTAAVAAAAATVPLSLAVGSAGWWHLVAVASGWAYNQPLKKTAASVVPYAVAFGLLVVFAYGDPRWQLIAAGALLGASAHFANVLPDLAGDAATGVRGLPHRLGGRWSLAATVLLLLAATTAVSSVLTGGVWIVLAVAVALAVAAGAKVAVFRTVQIVALVDVVLLLVTAYV